MINLDSTKAFIRDDRRVEQASYFYSTGVASESCNITRRKTPHKYPSPKELCLLVGGVPVGYRYDGWVRVDANEIPHVFIRESMPLFTARSPLKLNDVACLAEPWIGLGKHSLPSDALCLRSDESSFLYQPTEGYYEQPFSTMPPHLGKCVQIMGEPRVELLKSTMDWETGTMKGTHKIEKHHFVYPVKEVSE
jgi:hypothetical protein